MGTNPGQIVKFEKPIDASNVMLICPFTSKPTRVGYVFIEDKGKKKKFRFSKIAIKS
jgi:large subunit ribosomal protein L24